MVKDNAEQRVAASLANQHNYFPYCRDYQQEKFFL